MSSVIGAYTTRAEWTVSMYELGAVRVSSSFLMVVISFLNLDVKWNPLNPVSVCEEVCECVWENPVSVCVEVSVCVGEPSLCMCGGCVCGEPSVCV